MALCQQDQECKNLIRDYLQRMYSYSKPDQKKIYFLEMTTDTFYKPEAETQDTHVEIKMTIAGAKMEYESNVMSYYMDEKNTFVIMHPQKVVVLSDGGVKNRTNKYANIVAVEDTLLKHSTITSCVNVNSDGKTLKQIFLTTDKIFRTATSIAKVEYLYDLGEERVVKSTMRYAEKSPKKEDVILYKKVDYDYNISPFKNASEKVLTTNGSLLPKFKTYQLIDNRNYSKK